MTWLVFLGIAVVIVAFAAVTGFKPKGTRPVARSRMMGMGRALAMVPLPDSAWPTFPNFCSTPANSFAYCLSKYVTS